MPSCHLLVSSLLLALPSVFECSSDNSSEWGYGTNNGPDTWEGQCKNHRRQSPIDIRANESDLALLCSLEFLNYDIDGTITLKNTGESLSASGFESWQDKQPMIQGAGLENRYKLVAFHIHWGQNDQEGSEHTVESLHFPGELHMVHVREGFNISEAKTLPDGLAVVSVFLAIVNATSSNNSFSAISEKLKVLTHSGNETELSNFRMEPLLPANTAEFYRYNGSLTTPNCNEVVIWTVLANPIPITSEQMNLLRQLRNNDLDKPYKNYRPVQPLNGRRIQHRIS